MIRSGRYFALALLLATSSGLYAVDGNISKAIKDVAHTVVVDMEALFDDIKGIMEVHQKDAQKKFEEHGKKRQELQAKADDTTLPKSAQDKAKKDLEEHDKKGQALMQELQGKMMVEQGKVQKQAEERIEKVKKYADSKGHKVVLAKQQVIHHHDALDITADIKKHLGLK